MERNERKVTIAVDILVVDEKLGLGAPHYLACMSHPTEAWRIVNRTVAGGLLLVTSTPLSLNDSRFNE